MTLEEILAHAIKLGASDIHIEQARHRLIISTRQYGALILLAQLEEDNPLINRIKMRANLDLSETRRTQEGQFSFAYQGQTTFVRVSLIATVKGEKAALRLLPEKHRFTLESIGLPTPLLSQLIRQLEKPSGLILVCGATGAGKSTTLYSCLDYLNNGKRTIFTIEDPVEHEIAGLFQCEPKPDIGLTSFNLLKAFLRQDPDIIMVGEIRDADTANLAINASLTGHLVLATLHTNSTLDAIHRCRSWQVDFFSLVSSLKLIIHQAMTYRSSSQQAIFSGLLPLWQATLPIDYEQLIATPSLWQAYSQRNSEPPHALV
ncbi:GspE/PulE family protein [Marinomonas pollencensis]|uniref:General secretion pathway protein E n=1 Tax=Marinomonas pollencensis TaxID=491954 RepID=A0A3E0DQU0_9GAMM|nr:ATPase, T2SS/T4P/T4SS family [Marinomonas pollencensis]REG85488.1 general secretion pathway protein E [Marinomonas pollencensis]